jgi:hypothetical protein
MKSCIQLVNYSLVTCLNSRVLSLFFKNYYATCFSVTFLITFIICIRTVKVKDTSSGKVKVIYDAKEVISGLKTPIVKDAEVINIYFLPIKLFLIGKINVLSKLYTYKKVKKKIYVFVLRLCYLNVKTQTLYATLDNFGSHLVRLLQFPFMGKIHFRQVLNKEYLCS